MSEVVNTILSRLGMILRYVAPGFVALFVLIFVSPAVSPFQKGVYPDWAIPLASALTGVLIYSVHTGVFVPCLGRFIITIVKWHQSTHPWQADLYRCIRSSDVLFDLDTKRWQRRSSIDNKEVQTIQDQLDRWSEMLNFLYCSSYSMIFIPLVYMWLFGQTASSRCWKLSSAGILLLLFAMRSSYHILCRQFWAAVTYHKEQSK